MKTVVNISRVLVGLLFIFSGLVKAIDPSGLAYKMQEFFEVWGGFFMKLYPYALPFAIVMITLEVLLGLTLLLGVFKKITIWLLLLLIIFFTFLTSYVLFSGKIRSCGCFGDCIPLTPVQTFTKDIILLLLCLLLFFGQKYITPVIKKGWLIAAAGLLGVLALQYYVLHHLPVVDCLPFKKGNNILELRKMPPDATQDKFEYTFFYKKDGVEKEFTLAQTPDSTWTYSREGSKKLISKGNGKLPKINDFTLNTASGNDTTEALLSQSGPYYLFMFKEVGSGVNSRMISNFNGIREKTKLPCFYVTADPANLSKQIGNNTIPILTCDGTALKTAARVNPTLFLMKGPVVQDKWSGEDIHQLVK